MIGLSYRNIRRKIRWVARLVGIFCGFFVYEYISANPHAEILGVTNPYVGAVAGYFIGTWLVGFGFAWFIRTLLGLFSRLIR